MEAKSRRGRAGKKAETEEVPAVNEVESNGKAPPAAKKAPAAKGGKAAAKSQPSADIPEPAAAPSPDKKKPARKGKQLTAVVELDPLEVPEQQQQQQQQQASPAAKGKKGRKPAAAAAAKDEVPEPVAEEPPAKKGRGRKPAAEEPAPAPVENGTNGSPAKAKGRGKGKAVKEAPAPVEAEPEPAKRGRGKAKAESKDVEPAQSPAKKSKVEPAKEKSSPKKAAAAVEPAASDEPKEAAPAKAAAGGRGRKKAAAAVEEKPASPAKSPAAAPAPAKRGRKKAAASEAVVDGVGVVEKPAKSSKSSKKAPAPPAANNDQDDGSAPPMNGETTAMSTKKRSLFQKILQLTQRKKKKADDNVDGDGPSKAKKSKPAKEPAAPKVNKSATDYGKLDFSHPKEFNVKISSWNVAGLRSWIQKSGLEFMEHEQPDILCLQETKCTEDQLPEEARHIKGYHPYWLCKPGGYAGVAIYSKKMPINVTYGLGDEEQDADGRMMTAEYEKFYLVCVYVPNAGRGLVTLPKRMRWDAKFHQYLKQLDDKKPVVLCGDMNVAHEEIDLANPKTNKKNAGFTPEERDGLTKLLSLGFVDTFRQLYPSQKAAYTFWTYMGNARSKNVGWRLDYFIASERLQGKVVDNVIRTGVYGSDHCPITLLLNM